MFKKLALSVALALSAFSAVPAANASDDYCAPFRDGTMCITLSSRSGWHVHDKLALYQVDGYSFKANISCRNNPDRGTYTHAYVVTDGWAPKDYLGAFAADWCDVRLYS